MDFQIIYTEPALADLEAILEWSTTRHASTTPSFLMDLFAHVDLLKTFPNAGGPASRPAGVRMLIHSPFRVYYRVKPNLRRIDILHVWHGRRRAPYS